MASSVPGFGDAARLERELGDPEDPACDLSFCGAIEADESEVAPARAARALRTHGMWQQLVPVALGGQLVRWDELLGAFRVVSRRDAVLSVGLGSTLLGALPVWLWGSAAQRSRIAALLGDGAWGAFGLTEQAHGSDVQATDTVVTRSAGGLTLTGTKWLIGNAARAAFATVFARSGADASTLVLVDRAAVDPAQLAATPKLPTLGLRAHEIAGLRFTALALPGSAVIGQDGRGFAQAAITLQYSRTMTAAVSLGVWDTALRIALDWLLERRLYGAPAFDLTPVRELVVGAYVDLLAAECVALAAARALTVAPAQTSLWSAVTKYVVTTTCEASLRDLATAIGARFYLRGELADGMFQKLVRDHAIAPVFEGTTHVLLRGIAGELRSLAATHQRAAAADPDVLAALFGGDPAPPWQIEEAAGRHRLANAGHDTIGGALRATRELPIASATLRVLLELLERRWTAFVADCRELRDLQSLRAFELAHAHCLLHTASACIQAWHHRGVPVAWLELALARLLGRLGASAAPVAGDARAIVASRLTAQRADRELFSFASVPLGRRPPKESR